MIFNSLTFIYLCMLPCILIVIVVEAFLKKSKVRIPIQNVVLTVFSILFYVWGSVEQLKILCGLIVINYVVGRFYKHKVILLLGIAFNIGVLIYYKYINLIIEMLNEVLRGQINSIELLAPLGISFIIFQCISYQMDLYQDSAKVCRNFLHYALYILYFPKIAQGPIVKYKDMIPQIQNRSVSFNGFIEGCERFIIGLSKKVLIADVLASTVSDILQSVDIGMDVGTAWLGMICYTFQLYMDFSGYSDMAIGLSKMFGFQFHENFNFPYISTSITEFWRRWHISLGVWFREYLYFPLGGNRKGNVYINLFIVFLVTGIWHGAAGVYFLWGALHGVCVVLERAFMKTGWYQKIPTFIKWVGTFLIVNIGWLAFWLPSVESCGTYIGYLLGQGEAASFSASYYLDFRLIALLLIAALGEFLLSRQKIQMFFGIYNGKSRVFNCVKYAVLLFLGYLCFITIISSSYTPFLYFQF